jgi:hypothetical protein
MPDRPLLIRLLPKSPLSHGLPSRRTALSLCLALLAIPAGATALAEERPGQGPVDFLRLVRDEADGPVALETSIVRYARPVAGAREAGPKAAVEVDLVSAVTSARLGITRRSTGFSPSTTAYSTNWWPRPMPACRSPAASLPA